MKKFLLPLLGLILIPGLSGRGFQFYNKTGGPAQIKVKARMYNGKIDNRTIELKEGQIYTREDYKEIDNMKFKTVPRKEGFWEKMWTKKRSADRKGKGKKCYMKTWKADVEGKDGKMRRIKFYIKNNGLRYRSSWKNVEKPCGALCSVK